MPGKKQEPSPTDVGLTTTRVEVFVDAPDVLIERAAQEALPILSDIGAPSVTGPAGTVSEVVLAVEPVNIMC